MTSAEAHAYGIDITEIGDKLYFVKGGNLIERVWVSPEYDDDDGILNPAEARTYCYHLIASDEAAKYAFDAVHFTDDITLKDVLTFIMANPAFQAIIGCHCVEMSERGLSSFIPINELDGDIEYLEVYSLETIENHSVYYCDDSEITQELPTIQGVRFPSFHGIGSPLDADQKEEEGPFKKGDRINWGLSMANIEVLAALPLRLNRTHKIYDERGSFNISTSREPLLVYTREYSMLDVLKAIFWELTWYGPNHVFTE
jgi:hypothetical protein